MNRFIFSVSLLTLAFNPCMAMEEPAPAPVINQEVAQQAYNDSVFMQSIRAELTLNLADLKKPLHEYSQDNDELIKDIYAVCYTQHPEACSRKIGHMYALYNAFHTDNTTMPDLTTLPGINAEEFMSTYNRVYTIVSNMNKVMQNRELYELYTNNRISAQEKWHACIAGGHDANTTCSQFMGHVAARIKELDPGLEQEVRTREIELAERTAWAHESFLKAFEQRLAEAQENVKRERRAHREALELIGIKTN